MKNKNYSEVKKEYTKEELEEQAMIYMHMSLLDFLKDKKDVFITKKKLALLPNAAFIYKDENNDGRLNICFLGRTQCNYEVCISTCPLSNLHTITVEIEVGIDGKKVISSETDHFGLSLNGISFVREKNYDEQIAELAVGVPFDGKIPVKIIDAKDAELAAKGDTDAINRILKAAAEIA